MSCALSCSTACRSNQEAIRNECKWLRMHKGQVLQGEITGKEKTVSAKRTVVPERPPAEFCCLFSATAFLACVLFRPGEINFGRVNALRTGNGPEPAPHSQPFALKRWCQWRRVSRSGAARQVAWSMYRLQLWLPAQ